jgi:iron(III) transport system permease protein
MKEDVFTLNNYITFFKTSAYCKALINSVILGLLTVLVCGVIGTFLAFMVHFFQHPLSQIVDKLLLLPVVLPGLIIVFSFVQLYGESGLVTKTLQTLTGIEDLDFHLTGLTGILFVHAYTQYVYFYMNVSIAIKHIDRSVIEAARNLGASKLKIFITIIIPFIKPALIASGIITFMTGVGSFSAPSIIGGRYKVMTTQILLSKANNYMEIAATEVMLLMAVSLIYLFIFRFYENKSTFSTSVKGVAFKPVKIKNRFTKGVLIGFSVILAVLILLPVVTIIVLSFVKPGTWMIDIYPREFSIDNYIKIFTKTRSLAPFINSSLMAMITVGLCMLVAIPAAYMVVKTKIKLKIVIEALVMLPWAIPASAIAINMINAFNHPTIFTGNRILVGEYILLPLAYCVCLIPLMFRTVSISFQNLNDTYLEASKSLRANSFQTFRRIVIPMITPGIMGGSLLILIRSLGEYTISAFMYTVSNKPISIAMVNSIFEYEIGLAMAYGALVILLALMIGLFINRMTAYNGLKE